MPKRSAKATRARKKSPGRCVFCGAVGVTEEHVIGKALLKCFPPGGPIRHVSDHGTLAGQRREKLANTFAMTSRTVCRGCNGNWMRKLDLQAMPALTNFARNRTCELAADDQKTLAAWACKVALMYLAKERDAEFKFATTSDYVDLKREGVPPARVQVWLGSNAHASVRGHMSFFESHSLRPVAGGGGMYGATLTFGHGVFYLMANRDATEAVQLTNEAADAFRPLWPETGGPCPWPMRVMVETTDDLRNLSRALAEDSRLVGDLGSATALP